MGPVAVHMVERAQDQLALYMSYRQTDKARIRAVCEGVARHLGSAWQWMALSVRIVAAD